MQKSYCAGAPALLAPIAGKLPNLSNSVEVQSFRRPTQPDRTSRLRTWPDSHSTTTSNGRQQISQSVVNRCISMLASTTSSKPCPQNGHRTVPEASMTWQRHYVEASPGFRATSVNRCHHQTIFPSSIPSRNNRRAEAGALATSRRTSSRFCGGVAAVSKYHSRSGCLKGVSVS